MDIEKSHVKVVDAIMGKGKTSWAIQEMNSHPERRYIYISPFLDEASRIRRSCEGRDFREPSVEDYGTKTRHFHRLVEKGHNISSTHRMLEGITSEVLDMLRVKNYHLILDEAINVLYDYNMGSDDSRRWSPAHAAKQTQSDVESLIEAKFLDVNEENQVLWIGQRLSKYDKMRDLADRGTLYLVNDKALIWSFDEEVFSSGVFQSVTILSYQFSYQMMDKYLQFFGIGYDKFYVEQDAEGKYFLLPYIDGAKHEIEFRHLLKEKINIVEDKKLNELGAPTGKRLNALSKTWWERNSTSAMEILNKNLTSFFRYKTEANASQRAWSTFVSEKDKVKGKYINSKYWVPMNSRATNQYRKKTAIAYCVNRFAHPNMVHFFRRRGLELNHEEYATSEMLQFLFRFAIREKEAIDVYVPSFRMRTLLHLFLDGKSPSEIQNVLIEGEENGTK